MAMEAVDLHHFGGSISRCLTNLSSVCDFITALNSPGGQHAVTTTIVADPSGQRILTATVKTNESNRQTCLHHYSVFCHLYSSQSKYAPSIKYPFLTPSYKNPAFMKNSFDGKLSALISARANILPAPIQSFTA